MAIVRGFERVESSGRVHPTVVDCGFSIFVNEGEPYLQLQTYGSDHRASDRKVSQTIQLDRRAMVNLVGILADALASEYGKSPGPELGISLRQTAD